MTATMLAVGTADEWLLAKFDRLARRSFGPSGGRPRDRRGDNFERPIFELIDDHALAECELDDDGDCISWSGAASWPAAQLADDLEDDLSYEMTIAGVA